MTDCPSIRARCHLFLDGELPASGAAEVSAHLEACERCRRQFERQRAFLELVAEGGRETAPVELRRRVEAVLESGGRSTVASKGPGWRSWGFVAAAAVVALLFVAHPWDGDEPQPGAAPPGIAFAADYAAHAERDPSANPFAPGAAPRPPLATVPARGLSRCVIGGRAYAHFTYRSEGGTFSVFVPLDGAPPPALKSPAATVGGERVVVFAAGAGGGGSGAVLVSSDLTEPALRRVWSRG